MLLELYIEVRAEVLALLKVVAKPPTRISGWGFESLAAHQEPRSQR
ncbi:MAG: hypothetical protein QOG10_1638 [Kribbellaceae bacterium]|jgi:hypothetical protein|nr:hypothetical protein [Kribbellaceae bacterium]